MRSFFKAKFSFSIKLIRNHITILLTSQLLTAASVKKVLMVLMEQNHEIYLKLFAQEKPPKHLIFHLNLYIVIIDFSIDY